MRGGIRIVTALFLTIFFWKFYAFAQGPDAASLEKRIEELTTANKYGEAALLTEQYAESIKGQQGELASQYRAALNKLLELYKGAGQDEKVEQTYKLLISVQERAFGTVHPDVGRTLNQLALFYRRRAKYDNAELALKRSLSIFEQTPKEHTQDFLLTLDILTGLYRIQAKFADADVFSQRALALRQAEYGASHPETAIGLANRALLQRDQGRFGEAEALLKSALRTFDAAGYQDRAEIVDALSILTGLYRLQGKFVEAEPLLLRMLNIVRTNRGENHPETIEAIRNLALLYRDLKRYSDAEALLGELLREQETLPQTNKANLVETLNVLGGLYRLQGRFALAEPLFLKALAVAKENRGEKHPETATAIVNLARNYMDLQSYNQAQQLLIQALAIQESRPGTPGIVETLDALSLLYERQAMFGEAEPYLKRALSIRSSFLGSDHPDVVENLSALGFVYFKLSETDRAIEQYENAVQILMRRRASNALSPSTPAAQQASSEASRKREVLENYVRIAYAASERDAGKAPELREKAYKVAQLAQLSDAAAALSAMSARFAAGEGSLSRLMREHQDLSNELRIREDLLRAMFSLLPQQRKADELDLLNRRIGDIEARLRGISGVLDEKFPKFAELSQLALSPIEEVQQLLRNDQALIQMLFVNGEGFAWAVTKAAPPKWIRIDFGSDALAEKVRALRCGLDTGAWRGAGWQKCHELTGAEPRFDSDGEAIAETLPFDVARASALYRHLFGGIEDLVQGKRLLIVPAGALTQLPFEVLVTAKPDETLPRFEAYKKAAWLGQRQAITILPSVGSLKALSTAKASKASSPFLGFGNPLLTGGDPLGKSAKMARGKQDCGKAASLKKSRIASLRDNAGALFHRGGAVNVDELRMLDPLPETADELCAVAKALGTADPNTAVFLGERATVTQVKALSKSGKLAKARVVHFATHGALARETAEFAKYKVEQTAFEPALLLTPPATDKASDEDNGLLTASEVTQLSLDADWVIMSACNTAAGQSDNAEALSGLARAFFYAGARALLVSHWYVDSEAAVAITTGAVNAMKAEPKIGRAEALRRAEVALIVNGGRFTHPSIWAPFVLVGNGEQ
jgi:CHAT domain-containing protein